MGSVAQVQEDPTTPASELYGESGLVGAATIALHQAYHFAERTVRPDGHWCGELKANVTITAEYVFLYQALDLQRDLDREALCRYLLSEQNDDGSWGIAPGHPGDVSTSTEAYLALKLLGHSTDTSKPLRRALVWIKTFGGGAEKVRVFTRIYLAMFGLWPWSAVPQLPVELILMPAAALVNIYKLSSWARSTMVPLLVVCHHRPIYALPTGTSAANEYLDELWINPADKNVPYHSGIWGMLQRFDFVGVGFTALDKTLGLLGGLRSYNPVRRYALNCCMEWIISRQEVSGDWAGIFPPDHFGVLAYTLEAYNIDDAPVRRALEAIERFAWQDERGKRIQSCVSPVWDTVLMSIALSDSQVALSDPKPAIATDSLQRTCLDWIRRRQIYGSEGDWRIYRYRTPPGGFSFEYYNSWYPDIDDTAAAIIAFLKHDRNAATSPHVLDAVKWVLGMQGKDGGWAAFDVDNDKLFLNRIPFSDMDSLCDPSTADIVGRVLEAFGLFLVAASMTGQHTTEPLYSFMARVRRACDRGIQYLARTQEANGSWYGRWGVNYVYGTSNVLAGLGYFHFPDSIAENDGKIDSNDEKGNTSSLSLVASMVRPALRFILSIQKSDGGWGEALATYKTPCVNVNPQDDNKLYSELSTPSQTAWALMALLIYLPSSHKAIESGVWYLVQHQTSTSLSSYTMGESAPAEGIYGAVSRVRNRVATIYENGMKSPSQTLLPSVSESSEALPKQTSDVGIKEPLYRTWSGEMYTGTGFPNFFYLGYSFYSHYFPMMALGRYVHARKQERSVKS